MPKNPVTEALIDRHGADPRLTDHISITPFIRAVFDGNVGVAAQLMAYPEPEPGLGQATPEDLEHLMNQAIGLIP